MNIGNLWTQKEELQLMDEIGEKIPLEEIAKNHGRTAKAIEMRMDAMIQKQYKSQYTMSALMNLYNKSEKEIRAILDKKTTPEKKSIGPSGGTVNGNGVEKISETLRSMEKRMENIEKLLIKLYKKTK